MQGVKALIFDVFGTTVDWRSSLIDDFTHWARGRGIESDWTALVDGWRAAYVPSMNEVRMHPERAFVKLDDLQRQSVDGLVARLGTKGLSSADLDYLTLGWHRLKPWSDSVSGLTRMKTKFIISPLSNGNVALLTNMAKNAGLPWDVVFGADVFGHYKPDPETYLGAARLLGLKPAEVMLVAAHNDDIAAAQALGLKTTFVPRVTEYGPFQNKDFGPERTWDMLARDFDDLADQLGCA